jgi:hypothetical protein
MAYTYQFIVKNGKDKVLDVSIDDKCICVDKNSLNEKSTIEALDGVRWAPGTQGEECDSGSFHGTRKHFASIIREYGQIGTVVKESTEETFNNILTEAISWRGGVDTHSAHRAELERIRKCYKWDARDFFKLLTDDTATYDSPGTKRYQRKKKNFIEAFGKTPEDFKSDEIFEKAFHQGKYK